MINTIVLENTSSLLVPFSEKHLTENYVSWLNNPETVRYSRQRFNNHTIHSCREYFEGIKSAGNLLWAIEDKSDNLNHIGNISATIDRIDKVADIGIMIGNPSSFGKGHGFIAWRTVLNYLKSREDIHKITGGCMATNTAMIRIMEKSGMIREAVRPRHFIADNIRVDGIYYGLVDY